MSATSNVGHCCASLFNALQPSFATYNRSTFPTSATQVKPTSISLLDEIFKKPETQQYIALNHNGKIKYGSRCQDRHANLDEGKLVAPTGRETSLFDHFEVKDDMEGWCNWSIKDKSLKPEIARIYIYLLQRYGLVEKSK